MEKIFETICQQYLFHPKIYESLPFPIGNVGRWWGSNPVKKRQEEIDIMAIDVYKRQVYTRFKSAINSLTSLYDTNPVSYTHRDVYKRHVCLGS